MKLVGVAGVMVLGAGVCCGCGSPGELVERISEMFGAPAPVPVEVEAAPEAPSEVTVTEQVEIGVPRGAVTQPAPDGVFLRYTAIELSVDKARQYHDTWFRNHGWRVQVDQLTASGWTMEVVNEQHRLIVDLQPLGQNGVNATFKLL